MRVTIEVTKMKNSHSSGNLNKPIRAIRKFALRELMRIRSGQECGQCSGPGFKGRKAIAGILYLNDQFRELIITCHPIRIVREAARDDGTRFLRESAIELLPGCETTLQEKNRVTIVAQ